MTIRVTANTTLSKASITYMEFNTPSGDIIVDCGETSSIIECGGDEVQDEGSLF